MKKIEAIIRPEKLEAVYTALGKRGYPGITISKITGHGCQKAAIQRWHGSDYTIEFLPKTKIEIVCLDKDIEALIDCLQTAAYTGTVGDGKIFISPVAESVRIRTRECGEKALL